MPPISQHITKSRFARRLAVWAMRQYPPGFQGLSLYVVLRGLMREIRTNKLNIRGAAVTYNFFMAIPPSLLFFCSLIPYFPLQGVQESIITILRVVAPNDSSYLSRIVIDFMNNERRDILSFGVLSTFFFSTNGIMGLMRSFDRSLPVYVKRGAFRRRWTAIKLTALVLLVVLCTIAALILQTAYINTLIERLPGLAILIQVLSTVIVLTMVFLAIGVVYKYGPSLSERFHLISPGSVAATILCVILSTVFFFLVKNVIHYNKVYGSIGTLMAFMVWLFLNTQVILLGYELNVSILLARHAESRKGASGTSDRPMVNR